MSLEAKIERLEKIARASSGEDDFRYSPELVAAIGRLLDEATAKAKAEAEREAKLPLRELIAELRLELAERIKDIEHRKAHPEEYQEGSSAWAAVGLASSNEFFLQASEDFGKSARKDIAKLEAKLAAPLSEQITWLREVVERNEKCPHHSQYRPDWARSELARLQAN